MKKHIVLCVMVIAGIIGLNETAQADLNEGLVAYYPFNGNANDESGNGNNGTVYGNPRYLAGQNDQAISFDGVVDYISVSDNSTLDFSGDFSIAFWVKTDISRVVAQSVITKRSICDGDNFYSVRSEQSLQSISLEISNGVTNETVRSNILNNEWHYLVLIRSGDILKAYTNSIKSGENNVGEYCDIRNDSPLQFSNGPCVGYDGTQRLKGSIDEVRIYNRALSEAEIQELAKKDDTFPWPMFLPATLGDQ